MHDHRRSNVSIENTPAITAVYALGQRLYGDGPTFRARLGSSPRVDFDQFGTSVRSFVPQHRNELPPRGVVNGLRKHTASEPLDVQVFDRDAAKTVDDRATLLVQKVAAGIGDVCLMSCHGGLALAANLRSPLAARQSPLQAAQFLRSTLREVWPGDGLAGAERDERGEPNVNADAIGTAALHGRNLDMEDDVPLVGVAAENAGLRLARQVAMPADLDLTRNADEAEFPGLADRHAVPDAKVSGVVAVASPEPREARRGAALHATKERLIGSIQLTENHLLSGTGPTPHMRKVSPYLRQRGLLVEVLDRDAALVGVDAVFEGGVVKLAEVVEHLRQRSGLRPARLDVVAIAQDHGLFALLALRLNISFGRASTEGMSTARANVFRASIPCHANQYYATRVNNETLSDRGARFPLSAKAGGRQRALTFGYFDAE